MIGANIYVKVDFDEEGKKRIEESILTIREIIKSLNKTGGQVDGLVEDLEQGMASLQAIADGIIW